MADDNQTTQDEKQNPQSDSSASTTQDDSQNSKDETTTSTHAFIKPVLAAVPTVQDVYLNAKFNPDYVKSYRVLGFDNKVGALKDTTAVVEGGEIGSAYHMQVVFEIEPATADTLQWQKPVVFTLQYKLPNHKEPHELIEEPKVQYKPWEKLPQDYQFAGTVALFGSLLRDSPFTKSVSWNDMLTMAAAYSNPADKNQQEFVKLVQQAKQVYSKKKRRKS